MSCEEYWKQAHESYKLSGKTNDRKEKQELLLQGQKHAEKAIEIDGKNFEALRWAAVITGHLSEFASGGEKAEIGNQFKVSELVERNQFQGYLDRALAINNKEFSLLHMRGRYAFRVASLSWFEKKAAALIFSSSLSGSFEEALEFFLSAHEVRPLWIENLIFIARCYNELKKKEDAKKYLQKALEITPTDQKDEELLEEARKLLG